MNDTLMMEAYGEVTGGSTLTIQRMLPGSPERVWAYLTDSDLRRKWLASGTMAGEKGASFELVWRNDELTTPAGQRPASFPDEHRMAGRILEIDPPHVLVISWGEGGSVRFELEQKTKGVLLTLTHKKLPDRNSALNISAGWHMHLDILVDRMNGREPPAFWDGWSRLKRDYESRIPA